MSFSKYLSLLGLVTLFCSAAYADGGIGDVANNITNSLGKIGSLIGGAAYVAGLGFALAGMLKFKAHKDNPQQVKMSDAIVLLAVGAGLVFIPSLLKSAGSTLFGSNATMGSATGNLGGTGSSSSAAPAPTGG